MAELTLDQQKAMAMASARMRAAQASGGQDQDDGKPGIGSKIAGIVASPGFAAAELGKTNPVDLAAGAVRHPVQTVKNVAGAVGDYLGDVGQRGNEDVAKGSHAIGKAFSPGLDPLHRAQLLGYGAVKLPQTLFEPAMAGIEHTYGKLASKGSEGLTNPFTGKQYSGPVVTPAEASIVPSLALGGGKSATAAGKAAENIGIDLRKANDTRQTALGLLRDAPKVPETIAGKSGLAASRGVPDTGLSDIGHSIYTDYLGAEANKDRLYKTAEALAKGTVYDFDPKALQGITDKATALIKDAEHVNAPDDTKKAAEVARDFLSSIGKPYQEPLQTSRVEKTVGERVRTTTQDSQFPERRAQTTETRDPTASLGGGKYAETTYGPRETAVEQGDKTRKVTRGGYTDVTEKFKAGKNAPARETLKTDIISADKNLNEHLRDLYNSGSQNKKLRDFVKSAKEFIDTDLDRSAGKGDNFSRVYKEARESFQNLKKNYDTTANGNEISFLKKVGLDTENLKSMKDQTGRINPDAAKKINAIPQALSDEATVVGNELQALKGRIPDRAYNQIVREKIRLTVADNAQQLNYEKAVAQKPMLARLFRESNLAPAEQHKIINDYIATAKQLKDTGTTASPRTPLAQGAISKAVGAVVNAASLATFGLTRSAAHAVGHGAMKLISRGKEPENLYGLQQSLYKEPKIIPGAAVGMALRDRSNSQ